MADRLEKLIAAILALPERDQKHLLQRLASGEQAQSVREVAIAYDSETEGGMKSVLVRLPDDLAREARAAGLLSDKPLEELIRRALRDHIGVSEGSQNNAARPVRLPVYDGKGGLAKGIDPSSNRSMLDAAGDDSDNA